MRIAVISDVHANLVALEQVLVDIDAAGCDELWFLGDLVGYGPMPGGCVDLVREHADLALAGNHDLVCCWRAGVQFDGAIGEAIEWAQVMLDARQMRWLASLEPVGVRHEIACFHASIRNWAWEFVNDVGAANSCLTVQPTRLAFYGHTHIPGGFYKLPSGRVHKLRPAAGERVELPNGRLMLNPGAVGRPQSNRHRWASWMLVDTDEDWASWHRVDYPVDRVVAQLREFRLSDWLAESLQGRVPDAPG